MSDADPELPPLPDLGPDELAEASARLPEAQKLVVALLYYEKLTVREVGEVLGVPTERIEDLHAEALQALAERVQR